MIFLLLLMVCGVKNLMIVIVFSYHEDYIPHIDGNSGVVDALVQKGYLEGINVIINRYYMDTKVTNTDSEKKQAVADEILADMATYDYDICLTFDDNAFEYIGLNVSKPVVFTGLNGLPEWYNETFYHWLDSRERPGHHITGVYEKRFVVEALEVMSLIVPEVKNGSMVLISDNTTTGKFITEQIQDELTYAKPWQVAYNLTVDYVKVQYLDEYENYILNTLNTCDNYTIMYYVAYSLKVSGSDTSMSTDYIVGWTVENSIKPELSGTSNTERGMLGGLGPDHYDMGKEAGFRVGRVLDGENIAEIPIGEPIFSIHLNMDRANSLGIEVPQEFLDLCHVIYEHVDEEEEEEPEVIYTNRFNPNWLWAIVTPFVFLLSCFCCVCCYLIVCLAASCLCCGVTFEIVRSQLSKNPAAPLEEELVFIFTDVKNSTKLWNTVPSVMEHALDIHDKLIRKYLRKYNGFEIKTVGDSFFMTFKDPIDALDWACTVQKKLLKVRWPKKLLKSGEGKSIYKEYLSRGGEKKLMYRGLTLRMGIHSGRKFSRMKNRRYQTWDYLGQSINKTARVEAIARGGYIYCSANYIARVREKLESNVEKYVFKEVGKNVKLKGFKGYHTIYHILPYELRERDDEDVVGSIKSFYNVNPLISDDDESGMKDEEEDESDDSGEGSSSTGSGSEDEEDDDDEKLPQQQQQQQIQKEKSGSFNVVMVGSEESIKKEEEENKDDVSQVSYKETVDYQKEEGVSSEDDD